MSMELLDITAYDIRTQIKHCKSLIENDGMCRVDTLSWRRAHDMLNSDFCTDGCPFYIVCQHDYEVNGLDAIAEAAKERLSAFSNESIMEALL